MSLEPSGLTNAKLANRDAAVAYDLVPAMVVTCPSVTQ
jgi:hypothetical protein